MTARACPICGEPPEALCVHGQRLLDALDGKPVAPPGGEAELREALAAVIWQETSGRIAPHPIADALLPTVLADRERHARQRAAEELRRMADWIDGEAGPATEGLFWPALGLRNRADALTREAPARPADPVASIQDFLR